MRDRLRRAATALTLTSSGALAVQVGCSSSDTGGLVGKQQEADSGSGGSPTAASGGGGAPGNGGARGSGGTQGTGGLSVTTGGAGSNAGGTAPFNHRDASTDGPAQGGAGGTPNSNPDASVEGGAGRSGSDAGQEGGTAPVVIDECPGSLVPTLAGELAKGGPITIERMLYPYDGTVFPQGLPAPLLQWETQGVVDAVYLHLKSRRFEYRGCFGSNAQERLLVPANAWQAAETASEGDVDPLTLAITVKTGGTVIGPLESKVVFALGTLNGDLFYDTYTSPQVGPNGAVMKLHLGAAQPQVFLTDSGGLMPIGPCWSCHSLSANGKMLAAERHNYPGGPYSTASFDLVANPGLNPPAKVTMPASTADMGLGAVYPDGTKVLTTGSPGNSSTASVSPLFPDAPGNVPFTIGTQSSTLRDTATGNAIPLTGWSVLYAKMPSFSPDGSMVVFNWHEDSNGHSLAVADFDTAQNEMSNLRVIYKHDTLYPGWPTITPDNREVVFVLGNAADYVSAYPNRPAVAASDLWTVDIATKNARRLSRANGYVTDGAATYLPRPGRDEHLEFFPTVSPVAAGGYYWLFFTSRRTYGNILTDQTSTTHDVTDSASKKIWASAFKIRGGGLILDPSSPPFYVPGQELASGNHRPVFTPSP